jgi:hypothetical protein
VPWGGGPSPVQLDPEHCGALIAPGLLGLPPPQAINKGAVITANARPLFMASHMLLSPFPVIVRSNFAAR